MTARHNVKKIIYLAGKAHGSKWKIAPKHPYIQYISSDGDDHNSPHFGCGTSGFNDPDLMFFVHENCTNHLIHCDGLFAFLDTPDSYGSIAEIAYMSALGKDSVVVIITSKPIISNRHIDFDDVRNRWPITSKGMDGITGRSGMVDTYWFVSNFPHVTTIIAESTDEAAHAIKRSIGNLLVESPIERLFWDTFIASGDQSLPVPQYPILDYRLDFAFPVEKVAVELDGHDYHKEVEQRSSDAKRDRDLLRQGWTTLRFTGSDVHRNAGGVVNEVRAFIDEKRRTDAGGIA
jgi:very-short-patch-repair endonuclease